MEYTISLIRFIAFGDEDNIFFSPKYKQYFPTVDELLKKIGILDKAVKNEEYSNNTNLFCFVLKNKTGSEIRREVKLLLPKIKSLITENTLIYFDEVWKLIGKDNTQMVEEIYNFFKTLRKRKAGIVAISQDIGDLFNIDNGNLGKSILNNSYTKVFFKMNYADIDKMRALSDGEYEVKNNIYKLSRGEAYVIQGESKFNLEVIANKHEKELIEKEKVYEESINSNE